MTLNTAARNLIPASSKVRAKVVDGVMFIRPTERKAPVNLPKGEKLVDFAGGKATLEGFEHAAGTYGLNADKYGWFALTGDVAPRGPSVKIAADA
jgi:hypothetical protein